VNFWVVVVCFKGSLVLIDVLCSSLFFVVARSLSLFA